MKKQSDSAAESETSSGDDSKPGAKQMVLNLRKGSGRQETIIVKKFSFRFLFLSSFF